MNPSDSTTRRGIEAVVPYYLSQARQQTAQQRRQKAPVFSSSPPLPIESETPDAPEQAQAEKPEILRPIPKPAAIAVFADHLSDGREKLHRFVRQAACYDGPTALVSFESDKVFLKEFVATQGLSSPLDHAITQAWEELFGTPSTPATSALPSGTDLEVKAFIEQVHGLCQRSDTLMIYLDRSYSRSRIDIMKYCVEAVVLCGCSQDEMIATYQTIKALRSTCDEQLEIAVHISDDSDEIQAQAVFEKLHSTAVRYLDVELLWAGKDRPGESVDEVRLFSSEYGEELLNALDQYLSTSLDSAQQSQVAQPATLEPEPPAAGNTPPGSPQSTNVPRESFLRPIPLATPPQTDAELADILADHCAIWLTEYSGLKKLDIPLPPSLNPGMRLLAEPNGQVTILQAGLHDTESLLSRALVARQWLSEHLPLIRSALCRSLQPSCDSRIILVSLADMRDLGHFSGDDLPLSIHIKQAHLLQHEKAVFLAIL